MKLAPNQYDKESLAEIGASGAKLIKELNYQELGNRFGYMLSYGRDPSEVIQEEINECLSRQNVNETALVSSDLTVNVKYFKPNDTNLFALIECRFIFGKLGSLLAEFIITNANQDKYVSLEQIS